MNPSLNIKYQYYSNELNAGSTFVSETMLYVNPVNCFIYTKEHIDDSIEIDLKIPEDWKIYFDSLPQVNSSNVEISHQEKI